MNRVTVVMLGARMHYAVPRLLYEAGLLEHFFTDSYIGNKPWLGMLLNAIPKPLQPLGVQRWLGRKDTVLPAGKVTSFESLGIQSKWEQYRASGDAELQSAYRKAELRFSKRVINTGIEYKGILWGFNNASLELFETAKTKGMRCILEQCSNPKLLELKLIKEEHARWSDWVPSQEIIRRTESTCMREQQEWELADRIVAGSDFVKRGLIECGVPPKKINVIPYGVDLNHFDWRSSNRERKDGPLRILFVGRVSVMKGIPDLLMALGALGPTRVQARLIGSVTIERRMLEPFSSVATLLGHVPRSELHNHYQWADVFCFPSITEGSATVIYEALASGLCVITTPNSGSVVRDGVNGYIVPIREPGVLAEAIGKYHKDRPLLWRHQAASVDGRNQVGLARYRADLVRLINEI